MQINETQAAMLIMNFGRRGGMLSHRSDTPRGLKPDGFLGYAYGNPLRYRPKAVSQPRGWCCGLEMYLPVPALRWASSASPVRHVTMSFLPGSGLPARTPKTQLLMCNQPRG
jgi:hypothetical protein